MAWVEDSTASAWLLAGTRDGEVLVWKVGSGKVEEHSVSKLAEGEITEIMCSSAGFLFLCSTKGIHIAQVTQSSNDIIFRSSTHQPPPLAGVHVSLARWHGTTVLYCTPGRVHHFDVKSGVGQNVLLEGSDDEESCSMRPAVCESDKTV